MALDLKGLFAGATSLMFSMFDQVAISGTYYTVDAGTYDPATGATGASVTGVPIRVLFGLFTAQEQAARPDVIRSGDKKVIIRVTEVEDPPKQDNYFTDTDGARWDLELISREPTKNVWIVRARRHTK